MSFGKMPRPMAFDRLVCNVQLQLALTRHLLNFHMEMVHSLLRSWVVVSIVNVSFFVELSTQIYDYVRKRTTPRHGSQLVVITMMGFLRFFITC